MAALLLVALAASVGAASPAGAQEETIADDSTADGVSSLHGVQVWLRDDSRRPDPDFPAPDRLVQRVNGVVSDAPVRDRVGRPDLGTDAGNRLVAVYQRCTGTRRRRTYDCDVYAYRPGTRSRERRLRYASSSRCHESAPSIWRGLVVVIRYRRLRGCPQGLFAIRPSGRARRLSRQRVDQRPEREEDDLVITDVVGRNVLMLFSHTEVEATASGIFSEVRLFRTTGGRARVLASGDIVFSDSEEADTGTTLLDAELAGDQAYWLRRCFGADPETGESVTSSKLTRRTVSDDGPASVAPVSAVSSFAVDEDALFFTGETVFRGTAAFAEMDAC